MMFVVLACVVSGFVLGHGVAMALRSVGVEL